MLTTDENIVDIELSVQYRVSSAEDYLFNTQDPDMTLQQATKSAVRETVGAAMSMPRASCRATIRSQLLRARPPGRDRATDRADSAREYSCRCRADR